MGDPKKRRKHFDTPKKPWDKKRLDEERELKKQYGLKNKRELWKAETILRKKRKSARDLLAEALEEREKREKELLQSLIRLGLLNEKATLDDVLTLSTITLLERRLQTIVWRKGLANTVKQARQFIVHGHIAIDGKKVTLPSYLVSVSEEKKIGYYDKKIQLKPSEKKEKKREKKIIVKEKESKNKADKEKEKTIVEENQSEKERENKSAREEKKQKVVAKAAA